jgi:GT2 family glycosyltransferase/tetratricopeptide (TPR) repeat protein
MKLEIEESPTPRNYLYLGNEFFNGGDVNGAINSYKKSFEISQNPSTSFQAAYKVGQCYQSLENFDEAINWYKKCLDFTVEYREPLLNMAQIYMARQQYDQVIFWLEKATQIPEPKHAVMVILKENYSFVPHERLAEAYFQLKKYKEAIKHSEEAFKITRQDRFVNNINAFKSALRASFKRPAGEVRLNLGCGDKPLPGYINCDLFPQDGVDEIFSLDEIPYADHSVDEIQSIHSLEHLPRPRAEAAIKEWSRVLKKGGKLRLKVPDFEECCRLFLENPPNVIPDWYLYTIYGVQDFRDVPDAPFKDKVNYGQIHYTGFTEKKLKKLLTEAGFAIDNMHKYDGYMTPSISVEAHIPGIPSTELKKIAFINNTLIPKYLSYGDYWEDAFRATGHQVDVIKYEHVSTLSHGYDLYFFIEANHRYDVKQIPNVYPKVLYTLDTIDENELSHFDLIATPDIEKLDKWEQQGHTVIFLSNDHQLEKVNMLLELDLSETAPTEQAQPLQDYQASKQKRDVDIVIPSYKNLDYLKLTLDSIEVNSPGTNVIVVNSGDDLATRQYLKSKTGIRLIDSLERLSFSQAVNRGLKASQNDVVILNNDVIVGKNWLDALQNSPFDITNPFSNCDMGWIHNRNCEIDGISLHPNMFLGQVNPQAVMQTTSPYTDILSRNQPGQSWVAFYATYIRRQVIEDVGYLDENFINGGEDYDFCRRAVKQGYTCGHAFSSFVFHFGGKTRKISEDENYQQHHVEDEANNKYMQYKDRPTVVIYTGQAWEPWTINSINTTGIGGSETCAAMLAKKFAEIGLRSVLVGHCDGMEGTYDGVEYIHYTKYDAFKDTNYVDYFISSRQVSPLSHRVKNGKNYVWSHDIFIPECRFAFPPNDDQVTKYICLSPWHVDFFADHHKVDKSKIYIQGNGLDLSRYDARHQIVKDPYRMIYSSSPDRNLLDLLQMFPGLKNQFPDLTLHVFYGFDNWKKAIQHRNNPQEVNHLNAIERLMEQPGVVYHGRVSQEQLAMEQMKSSLWVYPTNFTETYCITAIECMLAGAVPVCTKVAALDTTVPDGCGVKVDSPWDCSDATLELLRNPHKQEMYRRRGEQYVLQNCGWNQIAQNWVQMFETT